MNKDLYCSYLAEIINDIGEYNSILEVGVGEATTFAVMLSKLNRLPEKSYGFDISWSRIKYARKFIDELDIKNTELFTEDLFNMPLTDTRLILFIHLTRLSQTVDAGRKRYKNYTVWQINI